MFTKILAAFSVIKELITLIKLMFGWVEAQKNAKAQERAQEREKAVEDIQKAQTEEDFDAAQDRIVNNRPRP